MNTKNQFSAGLGGLLLIALLGLSTTGCASVEERYKPQQVGALQDNNAVNGIEVTLIPDRFKAKIGDIVTFSVKIKNVGNEGVWIPKEPDILMTWVYPDGKRDNFVNDFDQAGRYRGDSFMLPPGQEKIFQSAITTYYFNRGGITEFRAKVNMTGRMAQASSQPTWDREIASNGFGVMFEN